MTNTTNQLTKKLDTLCRRVFGGSAQGLRRLSGGASQESWQFSVKARHYVMRRTPNGQAEDAGAAKLSLRHEGCLLRGLKARGLAVAGVPYICEAADGLGSAYIMDFIAGETIARKILRDTIFDAVRPDLAAQCGTIIAGIHAADLGADIGGHLPQSGAAAELATYKGYLRGCDHPYPIFEMAIKWLEAHLPPPPKRSVLVHGDFRNGNLMITPDTGVVCVLDWELAHIGDPMEDLGWLCVPSWRFGVHDAPVGGFGNRETLYAAYTKAGGIVDERAARFWEILGTLKWGIMCAVLMVNAFERGRDVSVERASIGRRSSETEIDLLRMILDKD